VHGQVLQKVQCPKCDHIFSKKSNLKAHVESMHREGASKFICHPCQKSFSNASNLKRRLALPSHSGVDKLPEAKRQRPSASTCTSANVRRVFFRLDSLKLCSKIPNLLWWSCTFKVERMTVFTFTRCSDSSTASTPTIRSENNEQSASSNR